MRIVVIVAACLGAASCKAPPRSGASGGSTRLHIDDVQSEIMAFADSYAAVVNEACGTVAEALPELRAPIHTMMLNSVQNAIIIAASPNPIGGLLDMTVMVSLQRGAVEALLVKHGPAMQPLLDSSQMMEEEIWAAADRMLNDEQLEALHALIPEVVERYRGTVNVASIRAGDFSKYRRATVVDVSGGGSLLSLILLDPFSGMTPAAREIAQTRLLAERAFFWANRLPMIINWQIEDVVLKTVSQPESVELLESAVRLSEASHDLVQVLPQERAAAIDQMGDRVDEAIDRAQISMEQLIDRGFRRGLYLVGVLVVGGLVAALVFRFISRRHAT